MSWILRFDDAAAMSTELSGGKGSSLAKMTRAGFPVPPGLIVSSEAYRAFVEGDTKLDRLVGSLPWDDPEGLRDGCFAIRDHVRREGLPEPVEEALGHRLPSLLDRAPVAVRSSSTLEDLAGAAFAGQHDTILNISGVDDVMGAVLRCWASLWEDRAARYRHEQGFDHRRAAMAVVVQSMVHSEAAGVAFTMNPISGDLSQMIINSSWGLGEMVVSGEGDVDQFVVAKESGEIVERYIATKAHAIVGTADGTKTVEVDETRRDSSSLTEDRLAALHDLAVRVEAHYSFPQDLEWAFAGDELFLLQARPVTRFPARWTRAESAERFPNPITPLTWDFVREGFHASLAHSLELMEMPPFEGLWFERFGGYIYGNETAVQLFTSTRGIDFATLDDLRELLPLLRDRYKWAAQLPVEWARDLDRYLLRLGRLDSIDVETLSMQDLWQHVERLDEIGQEYFRPNLAISITHGLLHRMLFRFLQAVEPDRAQTLYDELTCFCETKTNAVNNELREMANMIRTDSELLATLDGADRRKLWEGGELSHFPEFARRFERFLEDHGHREVDFDSYHPTWSGQPWVVLENLRLIATSEEGDDPAEREIELRARQRVAEQELLERVPQDLHYAALELVRLARAYTSLDDLEHYETTRLWVPFRRSLIELGSRLVGAEILKTPEDVFFLHKETLDRLVSRKLSAETAAAEAEENRRAYEEAAASNPPFVWGETDEAPSEDAMTGLPGSPGTATGEIFLVHGVGDFAEFPTGAVLVARTTNPAWTPLFYSAAAVVTESGGPLSHGAVTARELGIPAVMGVLGVMSRFENGDRVVVNGTRGVVELAEGDARSAT